MSTRSSLQSLWCFGLVFFAASASAQNLRLNELMAANQTVLADPEGDFADWVEIFNPGPAAVQLAGSYLSDDPALPAKWVVPATDLPATEIPPGGYLLLWLDDDEAAGPTHAGFKLDAAGESLVLTAADGLTVLDAVSFGPQTIDVSFGRWPNGTGDWTQFATPTPGAPNDTAPAPPLSAAPVASMAGGYFEQPFGLSFTTATPGGQIRMSFDGSLPDESDSLFIQVIDIQQTTVVRARTFAPGYSPGRTTTNTYFFGLDHTFPVVSLVFEPADFYDTLSGIYVNPLTLAEAERPVHAEWFEPDGTRGFALDLAVELSGTGSLSLPQKSLLLKAKAAYGPPEIEYPVFPDLPYEKYRRLVLRNSGQDWCVTQFRDAAVASLARDAADLAPVLDRPHLHFQGFRPAVVYFNGQYRGIHNVHEQIGADFLDRHFDLDEDDADLIDFYSEAVTGDSVTWFAFWNWLLNNHFQDELNFNALAAQNDLANFTDYCIFEILADNVDWPTKNWRRFRPRTADGQWHWLPFDFDLSFGLLTIDNQWNTGFAGQNAFARAVDSTSLAWPNPDWSTLPLRRALENAGYRARFLNRTADLLNTLFRPERVLARLDSFENRYLPEIEQHFDYWYLSPGWLDYWLLNVQKMKDFGQARAGFCFTHAVETFGGDTGGTADVTLSADPPEGGVVRFSTLHFDGAHLPWTGTYFRDIPIPVQAVAAPGWHFAGWSAPGLGQADSTALTLSGDLELIAHFTADSTSDTTAAETNVFRLAPNPARDATRLLSRQPVSRIVLYNALGMNVKTWFFAHDAGPEIPLDLLDLPSGSYVVAVFFDNGKTAWQRLVRI